MDWIDTLAGNSSGVVETSITVDGISIPLAFRRAEGSNQLCIFYNGAVNRQMAPSGIVFQRSTWAEDVEANCLFIADPAILNRETASIGWGQLSASLWLPEVISTVLRPLGEHLAVEPSSRLHYGSSAGGFLALACSAADVGSQALVNNPQTDWLRYDPPSQADALLRDVFAGASRAQLVQTHPWRARLWEWFEKCGRIPNFIYQVNDASEEDIEVQLPPFERAIIAMHPRYPSAKRTIEHYFDAQAGHSPMAKGPALTSINRALTTLPGRRSVSA